MFAMFKRGADVFRSSPARFLRWILNNAFRPYLKDEVKQDRFETSLWEGKGTIDNIELNEQVLNIKLNGVFPFEVVSAFIGRLTISIPWRKISLESVEITLSNVEIHIAAAKDADIDDLQHSVEKCLEKSLTQSLILNEKQETQQKIDGDSSTETDDYEENLGIESLEELFESIFSKMHIALVNTNVYIEREGQEAVCITLGRVQFSNDTQFGDTNERTNTSDQAGNTDKPRTTNSRKQAEMKDIKVEIITPRKPWLEGKIFEISETNNLYLSYQKNERDEFTSMEVELNFSQGSVDAQLSRPQMILLQSMLGDLVQSQTSPPANLDASYFSSSKQWRSTTLNRNEQNLEALQRSLLGNLSSSYTLTSSLSGSIFNSSILREPVANNGGGMSRLHVRLRVKTLNLSLLASQVDHQSTTTDFSIKIQDLYITASNPHMEKTACKIKIVNISLYEQLENRDPVMFFSMMSETKLKSRSAFECVIHSKSSEGEASSLPPLTTPGRHIVNVELGLPVLTIPYDLTPFTRMASALSLPSTDDDLNPHVGRHTDSQMERKKDTLFSLKCGLITLVLELPPSVREMAQSFHVEVARLLVSNRPQIWTTDPDDKPRLELRLQDPIPFTDKVHYIPCMMMDFEKTFDESMLFSWHSDNCPQSTTKDRHVIDLHRTKQASKYIVELILPLVRVEVFRSDLALWLGLMDEFKGGEATPSSLLLSIGRGNARIFQGTITSGLQNKSGTFLYVNAYDVKLLDDDNGLLFRKTPRQLRMDEGYCAPFALSASTFRANIGGQSLFFSGVTVGTYWNSWLKLFRAFERTETKAKEDEVEGSSNSNMEFNLEGLTLYYQPTGIQSNNTVHHPSQQDIFVIPPRGIVTVRHIKVVLHDIDETSSILSLNFTGLKLWLKEDLHHLGNNQVWFDLCHPNIDSHLSSKCLVPVVDLPHVEILSHNREKNRMTNINFQPPDHTEISVLSIHLKPDSLSTVHRMASDVYPDIVRQLSPLLDPTLSPVTKERNQPVKPVQRTNEPAPNPPANRTVNLDTSQSHRRSHNSSRRSHEERRSRRPDKSSEPFVLFDEGEENQERVEKKRDKTEMNVIREDYDGIKPSTSMEDTWEWIEGEVKIEKPPLHVVFPPNLQTDSTIKLNGLYISIHLRGGRDWTSEDSFEPIERVDNVAISNSRDQVEIIIDDVNLTLDSFLPDQSADMRILLEDLSRSSSNLQSSFQSPPTNTIPVLSLLFERGEYDSNPSPSFKLKTDIQPMRLYVDLDTLSFIGDFFMYTVNAKETPKSVPNKRNIVPPPENTVLFEYFELSDIDTIIDYKPKTTIGSVYSDIKVGNNVWAIKSVELMKAPITLRSFFLLKVKSTDHLLDEILNNYFKDFKQGEILNYLWGTRIGQPVQICLNIGNAMVDLIKTPVDEWNRGGNILKGIGMGATSLLQKVTVEVLNLSASSAITVKKGLTKVDKVLTGTSYDRPHISNYAMQPGNISEGATLAATNIVNGFQNSITAITTGGIRNVPHAILQPVIGTVGALSNLTLGMRNTLDKNEYETSKEKYKERG
ncbi:hypothetical protein PROFUN_06820 [Planoprotostelium fungivorum]|uniref:Autophagy-related protein 2 n=1 Tax=Planoprotostelium fungivorum TaxID=1890364 RepID=A0A2P6NNB5_9EUKA|nr:hypothetical protein PROFUN_06820 [Planoprotostelium fungivorum]